ncbi:MAG: nitrilase-related carbon-nitrogen hydrolase [Chloroflexota bacterium]
MNTIHIALCQGHWTGDQATTIDLYRDLVQEAIQTGATLICLPEFTLSPYFAGIRHNPEKSKWEETLHAGATADFCRDLTTKHNITLVASIFEREDTADNQNFWDTAVIYQAGELKHYTRKVHIPSGDGYHETDYFEGYHAYPVHDIGDVQLATPTCYDQWFPELARIYAMNGAELIYYPTAIGSEPTAPNFDSKEAWQTIMRGHAVANGVFISACNRIGQENSVTFYGSSFICDPLGNILAEASRDQDEVIHVELDATLREQYLNLFPLLHQRKPQHYARLLEQVDNNPPERWQNEWEQA